MLAPVFTICTLTSFELSKKTCTGLRVYRQRVRQRVRKRWRGHTRKDRKEDKEEKRDKEDG
jgi:hypothetical protein